MAIKLDKRVAIICVLSLILILSITATIIKMHNTTIAAVSNVYPEYTVEDLVKHSDIIAVGEVTDISDTIEIKPVGGGDTRLFTDYTIDLKKTYKDNESGKIDVKNKKVKLRLPGGEKPGMVVVGDTPKLDVNDEHLFFLKYPTSGGGYTVDDDHILLTGGAQGLLTQISDNEYYNPAYNIIDSKDLVTKINDPNLRLTAEESDPLNGLKQNLESGFINKQEYNEAVKITSQYAEIVNN